jgi:hypothetical protein
MWCYVTGNESLPRAHFAIVDARAQTTIAKQISSSIWSMHSSLEVAFCHNWFKTNTHWLLGIIEEIASNDSQSLCSTPQKTLTRYVKALPHVDPVNSPILNNKHIKYIIYKAMLKQWQVQFVCTHTGIALTTILEQQNFMSNEKTFTDGMQPTMSRMAAVNYTRQTVHSQYQWKANVTYWSKKWRLSWICTNVKERVTM